MVANTDIANIAQFLDAPARAAADRPALIVDEGDEPTVWSYGDLHAETEAWAATLAACGVTRGDRVALVDWGGVRSTAVTLAAAYVGAASAQMNPLLTAGELAQLLEVAECTRVAVACREARAPLAGALGTLGAHGAEATILDRPDRSRRIDVESPPNAQIPGPASGDDDGDDALILFTSGTTGVPKPVAISHRAVAARIQAYRAPFDPQRPPTVSIMCVPSFHVGGMLGLLLTLYAGDTTVIQPRFDAGRWLAAVARHGVTSAFLVPTMLARILDHPDLATTDTSSLRSISYGAAAAPGALIERAMEQWPEVGFANVFGQTETLGAYAALSPADHRDPSLIGSVGRPLPGVDVRVVDQETGEDLPPGQIGELWVRADQTVGQGWLATGDLIRQDERGYLHPSGRRADVINRGGEKFAPAEVADALRDHPSVADVVVAGVPDPEMGERVGVAIVVRHGFDPPTRDELRAWCRTKLAPFKLPEVVAVVDALPYNELGKLPRRSAVELIMSDRRIEEGT